MYQYQKFYKGSTSRGRGWVCLHPSD